MPFHFGRQTETDRYAFRRNLPPHKQIVGDSGDTVVERRMQLNFSAEGKKRPFGRRRAELKERHGYPSNCRLFATTTTCKRWRSGRRIGKRKHGIVLTHILPVLLLSHLCTDPTLLHYQSIGNLKPTPCFTRSSDL